MTKLNFNFDGIQLQDDNKMFANDSLVKQFYEYLEAQTNDKFKFFESARKKSNALATKKYI